ncbi:MAG: hypothetical protein DCC67_06555 [Planctomycetota bacterium]|nr:MAG: hypothetical protein DCC67_06555 [Planctomycetota bacterium]
MNAALTNLKTSKRELAQVEFAKLLAAAETRGFHGSASITLVVQDGHIQYVKAAVERMVK